jgi:signal peptidase II
LKIRKLLRDYTFLFLIAGALIVLDQISKSYIRANFVPYQTMWAPWDWMLPYARIIFVHNTGVAFGMFQGMSYVFAALSAIVALAIIYYFHKVPSHDWLLRIALCLQLAGAVGNLIDRVTVGYVTDFVSVGNFAVFNVADSCITVGVAVLILSVWLQERREKAAKAAAEQAESNLARVINPEADSSSQGTSSKENPTSEA